MPSIELKISIRGCRAGVPALRLGTGGRARPARLSRRAAAAAAAGAGGLDLGRHRLSHRRSRMVRAGTAAFRPRPPRRIGAGQRGRADRRRLRGAVPDLGVEPQSAGPDGAEGILIRPGDRIAQLVFTRVARPEFTIVAEFTGDAGRTGRQQGGSARPASLAACPKPTLRRQPKRGDPAAEYDPADQTAAVRHRGGARHRL